MSLQFDRKPSLSSRFRRRMGRLPTSSWSNAEEEASGDNPPRGGVDYGVISGKVDLIEAIFNTSEEFHGDNTARGEKTFDSFEEMEELGIPPSDSAGGEWAAETSYSRRPPFFPAKPFKLPREEEDGARNIPLDGIKFPNLVKVGNSSSDALKKNKSQKMRRSEVAGDEGGLLRIGSGFFREMGNPQAEAEAEVKAVVELKEMIYRVSALRPVTLDPVGTEERTRRRNVRISSDPQTVAARQRRERISERLRVLRRLVPGGSKMDTASMLDEAANYLKFLKSQISALQSLDAARCPSSSSSSSSSSSPYSSSSSSSSSSSPSSCSSTFSLSHLSSNPFFATRGFPSKVPKGSNPFQPF